MNLLEELKNINIFEEENIFKGATEDEVKQRKAGHLRAIMSGISKTKNSDGTIIINESLKLHDMKLTSLGVLVPYKIREVNGDFWCHRNELINLKGSPEIVKGDFYCDDNKLTTLKGSPKIVKGAFYCGDNKVQFTEEDVNKVTFVRGYIDV